MKFIAALVALIISSPLFSQDLTLLQDINSEPFELYKQANKSLDNGDAKEAVSMFHKVIHFYKREGRYDELPASYFGMALSLALSEHYKKSIQFHKKAIRAHRKYKSGESYDEIIINLGLTYELAGKEKRAKKSFDKV
jgi:tetratricopeptide (TPR) repeat protein